MSDRLSGRATAVLEMMRDPDRVVGKVTGRDHTEDGEWFRLHFIPNIGRKTIKELLAAGLIEFAPGEHVIRMSWSQLFRRRVGEFEDDLGDLWVAP